MGRGRNAWENEGEFICPIPNGEKKNCRETEQINSPVKYGTTVGRLFGPKIGARGGILSGRYFIEGLFGCQNRHTKKVHYLGVGTSIEKGTLFGRGSPFDTKPRNHEKYFGIFSTYSLVSSLKEWVWNRVSLHKKICWTSLCKIKC